MAYNPNNANGQATKANSAPVTIASDQTSYNVLTSPNGLAASLFATISAYGYLRTTSEPSLMFADSFDGGVVDVTNRWNAVTGTVTQTSGNLTVGNNTISTVHKISSRSTFIPPGINFNVLGFVATLETTPLVSNTARFFGFGVHTGTPSVAIPVTDGIGFEFDGSGKLWASIWVNSVRTNSVDISASAVAGPTRYGIITRADLAIFYIGSTEIPVASISYTTPTNQSLPVMFQRVNGGSVTGTPTTTISACGVHDTGRNNIQISDGTFPWRKAAINTSGAISVVDAKDTGRTQVNYFATGVAAGTTTTETAITLTKSSGTSATSTATSFVITSGKKFRITSISFATRGNATATIQTTTFNLRLNTAGAVTTSSTPILLSARSATPATASAWDRFNVPIPDGFEIAGNGTIQFGVTAAATYTTNAPTWDVTITGFEY